MSLPKKQSYPVHELELPSSKEKIKIRPFTGKEEKLFLLAKAESDNLDKIQDTVLQVISNCIVNAPKSFTIDDLTLFDIEFLFLQLHSRSIDSIIDFTYDNSENKSCESEETCPSEIKCQINIEDIKVKFPDKSIDGKIVLYDNGDSDMLGIKLKWPTATIIKKISSLLNHDESTQLQELIFECLEFFYDENTTYVVDRSNQKEIDEAKEMIAGFTVKQNEMIRKFFDSVPVISHTLEIKCPKCSAVIETMTLSGLNDFFL